MRWDVICIARTQVAASTSVAVVVIHVRFVGGVQVVTWATTKKKTMSHALNAARQAVKDIALVTT